MNASNSNRILNRLLLAAILGACLAAPRVLGAETRVGIIDLKKVFDGYWKTKKADAQLKEQAADLDKARKGMVDDFQKANDEYKQVMESANDQAISSEEREKRKSAAEKKLLEIKEIEQSINLFDRNSRDNLGTRQRRMRDSILKEIRDLINTKARAGNYSIVVDTAAETPNQTPIILFTSGQNDITDEVLNELNAAAPANGSLPQEPEEKPDR